MKALNLLIILSLCCSFTIAPKEVKLEYSFKVGDRYEWSQVTHQTIKQIVMGNEQIVENDIKGSIILKIATITATGAKIETQYTNLSMAMKLPAGMPEQSYNSAGDSSKMQNKVMKALMNKPFMVSITKQGVIESIEGMENLWSDLSKLGLSEQEKTTMRSSLEQSLSESSLRTSFEMVLINYPDKKIKVNDTWTSKTGMGSSFPLETLNTWSLSALVSETATISADGVISTTDKQKTVSLPNGIKSNFDLTGSQKITSSINVKSGWPSVVKINSEIKGNMKLLAGGMIPQDMDVPMTIITESNFTIQKN